LPIDITDFEDGGAYPEIHIVQYPLNMGKPGFKSSELVPIQVSENGKLKTDLIVKQGTNKNKLVQCEIKDLKEKAGNADLLALPDSKEQMETAEKTRLAFESLINGKISSAKASNIVPVVDNAEPTYIRYTPNPTAPGYN
jgi:SNW domain-containing protein 1